MVRKKCCIHPVQKLRVRKDKRKREEFSFLPVKILHDFIASLGQVLLTRYYVAANVGNVFCTGRHA